MRFIITLLVLFSISYTSTAKTKRKRKRKLKQINVVYASDPWNRDSTKIESAVVFFRDAKTKRTAKVILEESAPDSAMFSGHFSMPYSGQNNFQPEIYIPPRKYRKNPQMVHVFTSMMRKQKVKSNPSLVKTNALGNLVLDVYDTKEQAQKAKVIYQSELKAEKELQKEKASLRKPIVKKEDQEALRLAEKKAMLAALAKKAAEQETKRLRLEQLARQRAEELKRKQAQMNAARRKKREQKAKKISQEAVKAFKAGEFEKAEQLFRKATELDPNDNSYYFYYGATLFKNKKLDEALVAFGISEDDHKFTIDTKYYKALIHYKLKELDAALNDFEYVKKSKHPKLAPSAAFYQGLILYGEEKWDPAISKFEYVLDSSQDPKLDQKAEEYIEKISKIKQYRLRASKRFQANGTIGLMYDSNILFSPDNSTSLSASDKGDARTLLTGTFQYKPYNTQKNEVAIKAYGLMIRSFKDDFTQGDPFIGALYVPYLHKGTWGKKGMRISVTPGYEQLRLDADGDKSSPENIQDTILVTTELSLINTPTWFSMYSFEIRNDNSNLEITDDDINADALKYKLGTSQNFFMSKSRKKVVSVTGALTLNQADGKERTYQKIEVGVNHVRPMKWKDASWNVGLSLYYHTYPDQDTDTDSSGVQARTDKNTALNLGLSKPFTDWFIWGVSGNYTVNNSTDDNNTFSKYSVTTTATFNKLF